MTGQVVISRIRFQDGSEVELRDWSTSALYSCLTDFVFDEALTLDGTRIELGYTHRAGDPPPKVASLTLFEWSLRQEGCSYWKLRCHVAEYLSRERRGLRSDAQWRRMHASLYGPVRDEDLK